MPDPRQDRVKKPSAEANPLPENSARQPKKFGNVPGVSLFGPICGTPPYGRRGQENSAWFA
ncbi:hypothetical protein, partial [Actinokineospora alba]|uniref:hypothetical protein n=1 Tax=Actinokineospora alba TaxID=504798 RepID=UPI001E535754